MPILPLLAAVALTLTGCATIFDDSHDELTITSEPAGADVYWKGEHIGKTPFTYSFERQTAATYIEFAKNGYEDKRIDLSRKVAGPAWINLGFLTASPSSWGTDVSSGSMWEYSRKSYVAKLTLGGGQKEVWNEKVLEFVIANEQSLKKEMARGSGESMSSLCSMIRKNPEECQTFANRAKTGNAIASENGLEFYRALRSIDIVLREDAE